VYTGTAPLNTKALHNSDIKLLCLGAYVLVLLEFEWASAAADLQLRAVFAFRFNVFSFSYAHCQWIVPDVLPRVLEDVAEAFKVALTWIDVAVWTNAHVYHGCSA